MVKVGEFCASYDMQIIIETCVCCNDKTIMQYVMICTQEYNKIDIRWRRKEKKNAIYI